MTRSWIADAHLDLGWNALQWGRDLTQSVLTIRTQEAGGREKGRAMNTVALPEMRRGRVGLCIATLMGRSTGTPDPIVDFRSPAQAFGIARGHLAYYRALEALGEATIITTRAALDAHVAALDDGDSVGAVGLVVGMESADAILRPSQLGEWVDSGVRVVGPTHYGMGRYAGGTAVEAGFTPIGFELLDEMARLGVVLDLTHLSDRAIDEALDRFPGRLLASHSNCRALVNHQRQLSDDQIRAVAGRGGVIGVALDVWMLQFGFIKDVSSAGSIGLGRVVDHIDHICQVTGSAAHAGIGSDLDGGFGREQSPHDLDTIADLQKLVSLFRSRGYCEADIKAVLHGNWVRLLREALP